MAKFKKINLQKKSRKSSLPKNLKKINFAEKTLILQQQKSILPRKISKNSIFPHTKNLKNSILPQKTQKSIFCSKLFSRFYFCHMNYFFT
jgi:hypothetical protein